VPSGGTPEEKRSTLRRIIRGADAFKNALIFCNRKRDVQVVYRSLQKHGFSVLALHGDLDQRMRMAALDAFRAGDVQLLVCSDVAARGLDIPDVSHVINYDAPHHSEDYVHRIGRTGRAGKTGVALTIVSRADQKAIAEIEKLIARKIEWQDGAELPPDVELEAPKRERSRGRGGAQKRGERAAPVETGERPDRHAAHRADSRRHRAERPRQERLASDAELELAPAASSFREPSHGRQRPPREQVVADVERLPTERVGGFRDRSPGRDHPRRDVEAPVIGLGDHVPNFLLRPIKARARPAREPIEAEE
jgi:superfamily II DNA/RNA helicase